jgi:hypothetical protein
MENVLQSSAKVKIGNGKSKLITHQGRYALVPKSWLRTNGVVKDEDYSAQVHLSSCYEIFDDCDGVDIAG